MAYTNEDYLLAFSARTVEQLRQEPIWMNLTTQDADTSRWSSGAHTVRIPVPDWAVNTTPTPDEGVATSTRARGAGWATANRGDQSVLNFTRSGGFSISNEILYEDVIELPWDVLAETRARQQYEMNKSLDEAIYAAVLAGVANSDTTRIGTAGGSGTFLRPAAPYSAMGDVGKLIADVIDDFSLKCQMMNVNSNVSDSVGRKYIVMNPAVFRQLIVHMRAQGYSYDPLTSDLLRNNTVLAGAGYMGRLNGIDIISWNGATVPAAGATAGTNDWKILCGVNAAWKADVRPPVVQTFTPSTNQTSTSIAHLFRQAADYGHLEIHGGLMHRYNLRTQ